MVLVTIGTLWPFVTDVDLSLLVCSDNHGPRDDVDRSPFLSRQPVEEVGPQQPENDAGSTNKKVQ
jgi:hypothetical protein